MESRSAGMKIGRAIRDTWLIVGIAVLGLCSIEGVMALTFALKDSRSEAKRSAADPRSRADSYANSPWVHEYYDEFARSHETRWEPYLYWRRPPFRGRHINIDSNGIRFTEPAKPSAPGSPRPLKVFMFGGSTMWGSGARDAYTIPSILVRELQRRGVEAEVTNFGESGYVSTQEVIALTLQLQKGERPDLVIFYDGVNDVFSAYQQHAAGLPQNESHRRAEFNLSRSMMLRERTGMVLRDAAAGLATTRLLQGLWSRVGGASEESFDHPSPGDSVALEVLTVYKANIEMVRALGDQFRFKCLFYWQPTVFQKAHLTAHEEAQKVEMKPMEPFLLRTYEAFRQSGLSPKPEHSFNDLSLVLADVKAPLFLDWSHISESGNEMIAAGMAKDVLASNPDGK
jgi:lysophospholipase L1-like esterase